jgi:hypothetical protein
MSIALCVPDTDRQQITNKLAHLYISKAHLQWIGLLIHIAIASHERRTTDCYIHTLILFMYVCMQVVDSSCQPGTPQCFLLTPKLLPGLPLGEGITVLNIMNGPSIDNSVIAASNRCAVASGISLEAIARVMCLFNNCGVFTQTLRGAHTKTGKHLCCTQANGTNAVWDTVGTACAAASACTFSG